MQEVYNKSFYEYEKTSSAKAAKVIIPLIIELINSRSVVDVGCGTRLFLETAKEHGVVDLLGLDGEWISIFPNVIKFKAIDLEHPMQLDVQFDLAISLEVAEHLPKHSASVFINFLTSLSPVVLFSAAIPFQGGNILLMNNGKNTGQNYSPIKNMYL